jgi:hypothetical protein
MKNLVQITTVLFLLIQTITYSQTKNAESIPNTQDTILKKDNTKTKIDTAKFKKFIGKFLLAEGDFILEIIEENNEMYIISPYSKDILTPKNETALQELTRGVVLELIKEDENALKFTQNGYETTIKRVDPKDEK